MMLYAFEKLAKKLDQLGFPKIQGGSGFKLTKHEFEKAKQNKKIEFTDNGIFYIDPEGKKHQIYAHKQDYLDEYLAKDKTPRLHLINCSTIKKHGSGSFCGANTKKQDITNRDTREVHKDLILEICKICKNELIGRGHNPDKFLEKLEKDIEKNNKQQNLDINGYTFDFKKISKAYRNSQNYTCENCSVKPKNNFDERWWHTHHIDGDKTNNNPQNLKCLCVLCHSNIDDQHRKNFEKRAMPIQIEYFKKEYNAELRELNNPYI